MPHHHLYQLAMSHRDRIESGDSGSVIGGRADAHEPGNSMKRPNQQ